MEAGTAEDDPDLAVLQQVAGGRQQACRQLVDRHLRGLHAFATRLLGDASEAEDVCQDAFVKLWQMAPRWVPGQAKVSTWLYQVALNACRDRQRRQQPVDADFDALPSHEPGPERQQEGYDRQRRLQAWLNELPPRQREAMMLFHYEGHTQIETAAILDLSVDALESLLARARRSLRQRMDTEPEDL